jgi:CRISPR-associated protein Cas1
MTQVYVKEQGARVSKRGERLVISKGHELLDEVPLTRLDQLVVMGNVQVTTQTLIALSQRDIDVVYLSTRGRYRIGVHGDGSPRIRLRQEQLRLFDDEAYQLALAMIVVDGKINNQRTILQRQANRLNKQGYRADQQLFARGLRGMQQMQRAIPTAQTLDMLRGFEGKAGAYYFEAVRSLIASDWGFERRAYFPPPDPFNALLSFAYALVQKEVYAAVQQVGLDPYMGFLHAVGRNRPSMALDMMEEWRPVLGDALALELVNRGTLTPDSFNRTNNPRRPVELGSDGLATVLQTYESRLETRHYHAMAGPGGDTTLRHAILLQVRQLAQLIRNERETYEPFKVR